MLMLLLLLVVIVVVDDDVVVVVVAVSVVSCFAFLFKPIATCLGSNMQ